MKNITAKFNSTCAQLGCKIYKGEPMLYDYGTKKCYSSKSPMYQEHEKKQEQRREDDGARGWVEAQENAYCDNRWAAMNGGRY